MTRNTNPAIQTRSLAFRAEQVNLAGRVLNAVIATEHPTRVFDHQGGRVILESLLMSGAVVPDRAAMLIDHVRAVGSMVGSVTDIVPTADRITATLQFADTVAAHDAWALASQGHLRDVSVGYRILESTEVRPGRTQIIAGRPFAAPQNEPLRVVTRWEVKEVSLVPLGADTFAGIGKRSTPPHAQGLQEMLNTSTLKDHSMRWPQYFAAGMRSRGQNVPAEDQQIVHRALQTPESLADLFGLVGAVVLAGFRQQADSTLGWVRPVPLPSYLHSKIAAVTTAPRLGRLGRGDTAPEVGFGVTAEGWCLARFAGSFPIDEMDMIDGGPINALALAIEEVGAAARRLIADLTFSTLLANGVMADGKAAFHADRGNYATAALADTALDAGLAAVGNQTLPDVDERPVHRGLQARYLTVAPERYGLAKRLARNMATGEGDLIVRPESRLSTRGLVNPLNDQTTTANGTNWLLSCSSDQAAGVVIGSLNGVLEPSVRSYVLDQGQWGVGFDIVFDLACTVVTPEALYWSTGHG
jgi:hypothetical protein